MNFKEPLPQQCPPNDAIDVAHEVVYRKLIGNMPTQQDFVSHGAKGKTRPADKGLCEWWSCSLFTDVNALRKLPGFREKRFAKLQISRGSGLSKCSGPHVDFWAYQGTNLTTAVIGVI
jgi:hypothetical protein